MKKLFALLLILLFALPAVAFAAPGDALLLRQGMDGYYGDLRASSRWTARYTCSPTMRFSRWRAAKPSPCGTS